MSGTYVGQLLFNTRPSRTSDFLMPWYQYTGNLVGFGKDCYNYAYHSNGLLLHDANSQDGEVLTLQPC